MNAQTIQSTALAEKLHKCQQHSENLNDWEQQRVGEWLNYVIGGGFLSRKCEEIVNRMIGDIEANKKPLSEELKEIIMLANANIKFLYSSEVEFIEKLADAEVGTRKLSASQRSWLKKIESRIHKNRFI